MAPRWQTYEQGYALLDRLAVEYGVPMGLDEPWVHQLAEPRPLELRSRRGGLAVRGWVVPAGWFEATTCVGYPSTGTRLCAYAWAPTYERARRKAQYKLLELALRQYAARLWPVASV